MVFIRGDDAWPIHRPCHAERAAGGSPAGIPRAKGNNETQKGHTCAHIPATCVPYPRARAAPHEGCERWVRLRRPHVFIYCQPRYGICDMRSRKTSRSLGY